jgi:hypothetical protein
MTRPPLNGSVDFLATGVLAARMNSKELKRYLAKLGATFEPHKGGSGHVTVKLNGKRHSFPCTEPARRSDLAFSTRSRRTWVSSRPGGSPVPAP